MPGFPPTRFAAGLRGFPESLNLAFSVAEPLAAHRSPVTQQSSCPRVVLLKPQNDPVTQVLLFPGNYGSKDSEIW